MLQAQVCCLAKYMFPQWVPSGPHQILPLEYTTKAKSVAGKIGMTEGRCRALQQGRADHREMPLSMSKLLQPFTGVISPLTLLGLVITCCRQSMRSHVGKVV